MAEKKIDIPLMWQLWADATLSREEVARRLGVACTTLGKLQRKHHLPVRAVEPRRRRTKPDPTPDEIAVRARECRERHFAERRAEEWHPA